jgi:hypothetical protein
MDTSGFGAQVNVTLKSGINITVTGIVDNEQQTQIVGSGSISGSPQLIVNPLGQAYVLAAQSGTWNVNGEVSITGQPVYVTGDVSVNNLYSQVGISGGYVGLTGQAVIADGTTVGITGQPLHVTGLVAVSNPEAAGDTGGISGVAATSSSQTLLAANAARVGMYLYNSGTERMFVKYGSTAGSGAMQFTMALYPEDMYEMPRKYYSGQVDVIWAGAPAGSGYATEII